MAFGVFSEIFYIALLFSANTGFYKSGSFCSRNGANFKTKAGLFLLGFNFKCSKVGMFPSSEPIRTAPWNSYAKYWV